VVGSDLPRSQDDVTLAGDEQIPMARTVDEIEAEALNLPEDDRARIFESLLLSFQGPENDETARVWNRLKPIWRSSTMLNSAGATFQQALEIVEGLPDEQQQELVEIVRSRQRERRREALAASIEQARRELARGEVQRGTVDDLMAEIDE